MNLATSIPTEQPFQSDLNSQETSKNNGGILPKTTAYRSFGRELGNLESKGDSNANTSKDNGQGAVNHKENFIAIGRMSLTEDAGAEKAFKQPLQSKEQEDLKQTQESTNATQSSKEETEEDEFGSVDLQLMNNPQYVTSHVREIFNNLRETEERHIAQAGYIPRMQNEINEKMRSILVDWLVDVHVKFKLLPETMFLTVNLIDRYLEKNSIPRQKLQLIGIGAMLIASKYEDIYPPEIKEFEYIADRAYSREEIIDIEGKIILSVNFNLTTPSSLRFLERYGLVARLDEKMFCMAKYILELALVDYKTLKYTPSTIACATVYLVNKIHKKEAWPSDMIKEAKYLEGQLRPCAKDLCSLLQNAAKSSLQAVRRKFSSSKYLQVGKIQFEKA